METRTKLTIWICVLTYAATAVACLIDMWKEGLL